MRILVKSSKLWNGYNLLRDIDLTIENGVVYFGKKPGSYDKVFETNIVLPGFIDTHVHLVYDTRPGFFSTSVSNVAKLFIAHGILCVRDTGNYMGINELFNSINSDLEIITTYTVEKPPLSWMFMRMIRDSSDLDKAINVAKTEGCKWFKLYDNVNPDLAKEAVIKAHSVGLKTTCHVTNIGLRNIIKYGFDAFEHILALPFLEPVREKKKGLLIEAWEKIDEGTIEELSKELSSRGIAVSTTISIIRGIIGKLRVDKRKYSKYIAPWFRFYKGKKSKEYVKVYNKVLKALKIMWSNNVKIIGGTDLPNIGLNPGTSLWEEVDIMQEAGLDLWSSLKTVTGYSSEVLETCIGVVKENCRANLLLINREFRNINELKIDNIIIGNNVYEPISLINSLKKLPWFGF